MLAVLFGILERTHLFLTGTVQVVDTLFRFTHKVSVNLIDNDI